MHYSAILFDLDGTLLPMDTEAFVKAYFHALYKEVAPFGVAPDAFKTAMFAGVKAMMGNDGTRSNADAFWEAFTTLAGVQREVVEPICDTFYTQGFHGARAATGDNPLAREAVKLARQKADRVILATNPLFPLAGQRTRLSWIGLAPEDFDLVTYYATDRFCKPNPAYYVDICERMGLNPANCLMIGNDDREDMMAASSLGMDTYLVTNWRLPHAEKPWQGDQGTFEEMLDMLRSL
ncbi:MAG: HAD family hydrolase [Clostridia bacterium]|nr:HAD family hydrolase [Clostridia bacterium]